MASWAEDMERSAAYDEQLRAEPGFVPDPKPPARVKADLKDWQRMREMVASGCQVCGGDGWDANRPIGLSLHHLVPKSQGGDDVPENLAVLCGHGTAGCHGDVEARRNKARERLRENMTQEQFEYVEAKKGAGWIMRHYPLYPSATKGMGSSDA